MPGIERPLVKGCVKTFLLSVKHQSQNDPLPTSKLHYAGHSRNLAGVFVHYSVSKSRTTEPRLLCPS